MHDGKRTEGSRCVKLKYAWRKNVDSGKLALIFIENQLDVWLCLRVTFVKGHVYLLHSIT